MCTYIYIYAHIFVLVVLTMGQNDSSSLFWLGETAEVDARQKVKTRQRPARSPLALAFAWELHSGFPFSWGLSLLHSQSSSRFRDRPHFLIYPKLMRLYTSHLQYDFSFGWL